MNNKFLTVDEAANALRVVPETVYRRIKTGDIKAAKPFGEYRIPIEEIERLLTLEEPSEQDARDAGAVVE